jgi:alpha-tubulin suppressor-like RCC1 family protein
LAIRQNGTAWAWGYNSVGQLGDGTIVAKCSPVSVIGGFTDWCQISAGENSSSAVRNNGTAWTWGYGNNGTLGIGSTQVCRSSPSSVIGNFKSWCSLCSSAASAFTVGIAEI